MALALSSFADSGERAIELIKHLKDKSPIIDVSKVISNAQGFVDELCAQLIASHIDKVTFIETPDNFKEYFMMAHYLRNGKFMVEFR